MRGGSYIYAHIVGKFDIPEVGATVTATFQATPAVALCKSVSGVTDSNGDVLLHVCGGLDVTGGTGCLSVRTTVWVYGYKVAYCETCPTDDTFDCSDTDLREWLSPDMNGDLAVNSLDFSIFASDWQKSACRSDFNCDGVVNSLDYSILASHWQHTCSRCP